MESELTAIGEVARRSGLTVSALRYYDEAGVLVPAAVDPLTGYRFYSPAQVRLARLVARLRRVGMPVAVLRRVVADPAAAGPLLDAHLGRLEQALADARRELSAARTLLDHEEPTTTGTPTTLTTTAGALAAALAAVRFAAGADAELPGINGVLLDAGPDETVLVATDRYRLAISPLAGARVEGAPAQALLPTGWVDELLAVLEGAGDVTVTVGADQVAVRVADAVHSTVRPDLDYPDYRRLVRDDAEGVVVEPVALRAGIELSSVLEPTSTGDGGSGRVALLRRDDDTIAVPLQPGGSTVAFDRDYLLQAVEAAGGEPLTLALDGPHEPLVIRIPGGGVSLLMPLALP